MTYSRFNDTRTKTQRWKDFLDQADFYSNRGVKWRGVCQSGFAQACVFGGELILEHTAAGKRIFTLDGKRIKRIDAYHMI